MQTKSECVSLEELSDFDLMRQFQAGNSEAFGYLFSRHKAKLLSVSIRCIRNLPDAEDAIQIGFISAMRGAKNFRFEAQVSTWLTRIIINTCTDVFQRKPVIPTQIIYEQGYDQIEEFLESFDPDLQMELKRALLQLPLLQKRALVMMEFFGYTIKELAEIENCAQSTIKSRCFRARAKMRSNPQLIAALLRSQSRG
jgi:RNA polymerase sigma-70 factor, ECF subfamily